MVHKQHLLALALFLATGSAALAGAQDRDPDDDEPVEDEAAVEDEADVEDEAAVEEARDIENDVDDEEGDDPGYGEAGVWELGGSLGFYWTEDVFTLNLNPQVGLFVIDYFELSILLGLQHENVRDADGSRHGETTFSALLEPSYHVPVIEDDLFLLGGLGVGVGYDGVTAGFDLVPRVGANIALGRTRVLTPSLRVPIIMGSEVNENGDSDFNTSVSVGMDVGYTTTF